MSRGRSAARPRRPGAVRPRARIAEVMRGERRQGWPRRSGSAPRSSGSPPARWAAPRPSAVSRSSKVWRARPAPRSCFASCRSAPHPTRPPSSGAGKVETLKHAAAELGADLVIFDNELTPAQLRNLEKRHRPRRRSIARSSFSTSSPGARARAKGQLQVELAQLKYLMPRLVGSAAWLSRLGGGIGTRGPGETKLETDRRHIRHRHRDDRPPDRRREASPRADSRSPP